MISDDRLFEIYTEGWKNCSNNKEGSMSGKSEYNGIEKIAYDHGWFHYIAGDDQPSIDLLTKEQIVVQIKGV